MKKWFLFLMLLVAFTLTKASLLQANSDYQAFEEVTLKDGKFLKDISSSDLNKYYKKVNKRKFYGWRSYDIHSDLKLSYKTETLFSYHNDGATPIKYSYSMKKKNVETRSLTSTGDIKVKISGKIQSFSNNLDSQLKLNSQSTEKKELEEEYKIQLDIDPGTRLNLYIYGEGKITNGVAVNYIFWLKYKKGGYEIFTVTTQYYRLEKVRI